VWEEEKARDDREKKCHESKTKNGKECVRLKKKKTNENPNLFLQK
jgi:hypothetical protein